MDIHRLAKQPKAGACLRSQIFGPLLSLARRLGHWCEGSDVQFGRPEKALVVTCFLVAGFNLNLKVSTRNF
jgi:hypothetical protein